jgi:hypothetical protein
MDNQSRIREQEEQALRSYLAGRRPNRQPGGRAKPLFSILVVVLLAGVVYVGLTPWAFFMGGHFHPLGYWAGWGRMHSKTAGDYFLYVQISPQPRPMEKIVPHTFVKGFAHLCTPKGERYYLKLSGSMSPHIYLNTVGQPIDLNLHNWRDALIIGQEQRPAFYLWGQWGPGDLVADDRQTLSKAFLPDGALRPATSRILPAELEDTQLTLHEGTYSQWEAACANAQY